MKKGEIKTVVQSYTSHLPAPWQRVGNEFMRYEGDWVQIVTFNASRFTELYVPRNCMEYLKMPGVPTGGFLVQELHNRNGTQHWVRTTDASAKVFEEMTRQFKPALLNPLNIVEIKNMLTDSIDYWPHAYALCVMACEAGNFTEGERSFDAFLSATADKPYSWVETRRQELTECMKLAENLETLRTHLETVRINKLSALKLAR